MGKNIDIQIHLAFKTTTIGSINNIKKGQLEITNFYTETYEWIGSEYWENLIVNKEEFYDNCRWSRLYRHYR